MDPLQVKRCIKVLLKNCHDLQVEYKLAQAIVDDRLHLLFRYIIYVCYFLATHLQRGFCAIRDS